MDLKLNIAIEKGVDGWYVGYLEEIPAVMSQGKTIEELKGNIQDALELFLETQRMESQKLSKGKKFLRRKLEIV